MPHDQTSRPTRTRKRLSEQTIWLKGISLVARHDVNVGMLDGLSGHSSVVDGEIETRRQMPIIKLLLHRSHKLKASGILFQRQVEDAGNMLLRNDQTVALRQRMFVGNGQTELVLQSNPALVAEDVLV